MIITEEEAKKKGLEEILKKVNNGEQETIVPVDSLSLKEIEEIQASLKDFENGDYEIQTTENHFQDLKRNKLV